jgi:hypothetical protein
MLNAELKPYEAERDYTTHQEETYKDFADVTRYLSYLSRTYYSGVV